MLVVAMGIPGCGKSSVFKCLEKTFSAKAFYEPEEELWPEAVKDRADLGYFSSITWFRSIRVPDLIKAYQLSLNDDIVFVDTYYDKLLFQYIDSNGLEWLLPKDDEYFKVIKDMSRLDYELLPNADVIVFFKIDTKTWINFLNKRNRKIDNESLFREQCFSLQEPMFIASKTFVYENNKHLIIVEQEYDSPQNTANKLKIELEKISEKICTSFNSYK